MKILQIIKKYVCQLYTNNLDCKHPRLLTSVRKLICLSGILLSYLDSVNKQSYINCGAKLELANVLAQSLHQWNKANADGGDRIRTELMFLQPQWLSMLISRQLLKLTASGSLPQKLTSLTELTSAMTHLTLETSAEMACYESLIYRTTSSCHLHTLVRTLWSQQSGLGQAGGRRHSAHGTGRITPAFAGLGARTGNRLSRAAIGVVGMVGGSLSTRAPGSARALGGA